MKKKPVLLIIVFVLLFKGGASASSFEIRNAVYRSDEIGIEFNIPGGWQETDFNVNGADEVKSYIYPSQNPEIIIFCNYDIWKDMSTLQKAQRSRSDISLDSFSRAQIGEILKPFKLDIGELNKVSFGGHTYLKTSVESGAESSLIRADAVFTVMNGYCYLFVYSGLSGQSRHYADFEKLLDSAEFFRANTVSASTAFLLSLVISLFAALLPTVIYKTAVLRRKLLSRKHAKRAVVLLTALPGIVVSAILFIYFENIVSIFVFALCAILNYTILGGGANVLSYSIEKIPISSDTDILVLPVQKKI